jgi:hypothetical protein
MNSDANITARSRHPACRIYPDDRRKCLCHNKTDVNPFFVLRYCAGNSTEWNFGVTSSAADRLVPVART